MGTENQSLPGYVVILDRRGGPIGGQPKLVERFHVGGVPGDAVPSSRRPDSGPSRPAVFDASGSAREQLDMLAQLNEQHLAARPGGDELAARIGSYELAFRMQTETPGRQSISVSKPKRH